MENKTCGNCKRYQPLGKSCDILLSIRDIEKDNRGCQFFKALPKMTNGDRIRQMSNRELAELITPKVIFCNGCPAKCAEKDIPQRDSNDPFGADVASDVCVKRVENWLNSEVKQ